MSKAGVTKTQKFRKPRERKKVTLEERMIDSVVVVGQECTKCCEWKPLSDFHKQKGRLGGVRCQCKSCRNKIGRRYVKTQTELKLISGNMKEGKRCTECSEWKILEDYYVEKRGNEQYIKSKCKECQRNQSREWKVNNKERIKETAEKWKAENCMQVNEYMHLYGIRYRERNKTKIAEQKRIWKQNNPERVKLSIQVRRARKKSLPHNWTLEQKAEMMDYFDGKCALTGESKITEEHAIPLSIGHGGTVHGNMWPLCSRLNSSKYNKNIFEWFETNRQRFELSQAKFDRLIEWLAAANEMTVEEYRDYVYWCHENPNDVLESEAI
ncbi:hypothetical protein [Bacillus wiedmannii]|uniref:HNH endonuclease n=1 Tax=Bacillus wiedmannii TaxID=1890302 RepID=A0ABX5DMX2_9BACI|nr:hypothetical protein [Bacillus wiedmannii]PRT35311.1 hypothetical protein C6357_29385 [Bacillus wiedmannii]